MSYENLQTVNNFCREYGYSASYIYRLYREGKFDLVIIDGVKFVDKNKIPADFKRKS